MLQSNRVLRWLLVVPAGVVSAALIAFPVHWIVMSTLGGWSEYPIIEIRDQDTLARIEMWAQAACGPFAFVYGGSRVAPSKSPWVALTLAAGVLSTFVAAPYLVQLAELSISVEQDASRLVINALGVLGAIGLLHRNRKPRLGSPDPIVGARASQQSRTDDSRVDVAKSQYPSSDQSSGSRLIDQAPRAGAVGSAPDPSSNATGQKFVAMGLGYLLTAGLCGIAAAGTSLPYAYFQILRWSVFVVCGIETFSLLRGFARYQRSKWYWFSLIACMALAVLFNPIAPIYLQRVAWRFVDAIAGCLLLLFGVISLMLGWAYIVGSKRAA